MEVLETKGIDKSHLKKYSAALSQLRANNVVLERVYTHGQPVPEIYHVIGRLSKNNFKSLAAIFEMKGLGGARLFPKGIINPEALDIHFEFDAKVIQG